MYISTKQHLRRKLEQYRILSEEGLNCEKYFEELREKIKASGFTLKEIEEEPLFFRFHRSLATLEQRKIEAIREKLERRMVV